MSRPVELLFGHAPGLYTKHVAKKLHGLDLPTDVAGIAKLREVLTGEVDGEGLAKIEEIAVQKQASLARMSIVHPAVSDDATSTPLKTYLSVKPLGLCSLCHQRRQ